MKTILVIGYRNIERLTAGAELAAETLVAGARLEVIAARPRNRAT